MKKAILFSSVCRGVLRCDDHNRGRRVCIHRGGHRDNPDDQRHSEHGQHSAISSLARSSESLLGIPSCQPPVNSRQKDC